VGGGEGTSVNANTGQNSNNMYRFNNAPHTLNSSGESN